MSRFECGKIRTVMDVFGQGIPEGGGNHAENCTTPGPVLGSKWWREKVCFGGLETMGWCVAEEQGGKVAGGLIMEGFVG